MTKIALVFLLILEIQHIEASICAYQQNFIQKRNEM